MKRIICWILCILLLLCGCDTISDPSTAAPGILPDTQQEDTTTLGTPGVLFYPDADINPITTRSAANHYLLRAVYAPLVYTDSTLQVIPTLASYEVSGTTVTLQIKETAKFSDGTTLSAADVVYSFQMAMSTASSPYHAQTADIKKITARDKKTVDITLKSENVDIALCLDIPIIGEKNGLGCGPYCFGEKDGEKALVANPHTATPPAISTLLLREANDEAGVLDMFSSGVIDMLPQQLTEQQTVNFNRNYQTITRPTDQLLYVGINQQNETLSNAAVRQALYLVVDRAKIAKSVLVGMASVTRYPYPANWYRAPQSEAESTVEASVAAMQGGGFVRQGEEKWVDAQGKEIALRLLVCQEAARELAVANELQSQLSKFGITVTLQSVNASKFSSLRATGQYDLFVDTYALGRTMRCDALFTPGNANTFGVAEDTTAKAYTAYRSNGQIIAFQKVFSEQLPILPIAFLSQPLYLTEGITPDSATGPYTPYGDMATWKAS